MITDEDIVVPSYDLVADFSQVTLFTFDTGDTATINGVGATIMIADGTATVEDQAAGKYDVVFVVTDDNDARMKYTAKDVEFAETAADENGAIKVVLKDGDFEVPIP